MSSGRGRPRTSGQTSSRPAAKPPTCAKYATPPPSAETRPADPSSTWNRNQAPSSRTAGTSTIAKKHEQRDRGQHPGTRVEHEVGAEHARDRARRADVGDAGGRVGRELGEGREHAAHEVEERVAQAAHAILDVVAEDPEEQHVADDVHPAAVHEDRGDQGQPGGVLRDAHLGDAATGPREVGSSRMCAAVDELARDEAPLGRDAIEAGDLSRNARSCSPGRWVVGREISNRKTTRARDDQRKRDDREPPRTDVVAKREHPRVNPSARTRSDGRASAILHASGRPPPTNVTAAIQARPSGAVAA